MAQAAIDEGHLEAFDTIVGDVGYEVNVFNVKFAIGLAFGIYFSEQFYLVFIKVFAHLFYHPYIAEKLGAKVAVAHHRFAYHTKVGIYQLYNFVLWAYLHRRYLIEFVRQSL